MEGGRFFIVDVFAEEKLSGNQLAVFMEGHLYTDKEMQKLAKEIGFSETTFIFPHESSGGAFKVRIFTPEAEIPFAGHPTLGTAFIIQNQLLHRKAEKVFLDLRIGRIPVSLTWEIDEIKLLTMEQREPRFGRVVPPESVAKVLGISPNEIDGSLPCEEVSTGLPSLIVPLKSLGSVKAISVDVPAYHKLICGLEANTILVFSPETEKRENHLHVRVFAHALGVPEDPATGSANGCLVGYLLKHGIFGSGDFDIRVEQGYEIGRKSLLYLSGRKEEGRMRVFVGGRVIPVAEGRLL